MNAELNFFSLVNDFEVYLSVKVMTRVHHGNLHIFFLSPISTSTILNNFKISEI